jgi:hypothetical protein
MMKEQAMTEFNVSQMSRKLGLISEVMADGYHFVRMRDLVDDWQARADAGDATAQELIKVINTFHRLCQVVKNG